MKAGRHADTYSTMLKIYSDKKKLKLTPIDSDIYQHFRSIFPSLNISVLSDDFVTRDHKLWLEFINSYKHNSNINDYQFGTILRKNCSLAADSDNTMLVCRIIFLAIEIARNREGNNDNKQNS